MKVVGGILRIYSRKTSSDILVPCDWTDWKRIEEKTGMSKEGSSRVIDVKVMNLSRYLLLHLEDAKSGYAAIERIKYFVKKKENII